MLKILRLRPFTVRDLQFVVLIKPFEDSGLVEDFARESSQEVELVADICSDYSNTNYHFDHILLHTNANETPSTLFQHLHRRDVEIPTLIVCDDDGYRRTHIKALKNYHELQSLLGLAANRGLVKDAQHLL